MTSGQTSFSSNRLTQTCVSARFFFRLSNAFTNYIVERTRLLLCGFSDFQISSEKCKDYCQQVNSASEYDDVRENKVARNMFSRQGYLEDVVDFQEMCVIK